MLVPASFSKVAKGDGGDNPNFSETCEQEGGKGAEAVERGRPVLGLGVP